MIAAILMIVLVLADLTVPADIEMEEPDARGGQKIPHFAGPVKVVFSRVVSCPPPMLGENVHRMTSAVIKQTREKPEPRFYGNFESLEPFDDTLVGSASLASWSRVSGWVSNAVKFRFRKLCSDLKAYYKMFVDVLEKYVVDGKKLCPRQSSNFTIDGAPAYFVPGNLVVAFPYGRWRADFTFLKDNTVKGCVRFFVDTVPLLKESPYRKKNGTATNSTASS